MQQACTYVSSAVHVTVMASIWSMFAKHMDFVLSSFLNYVPRPLLKFNYDIGGSVGRNPDDSF